MKSIFLLPFFVSFIVTLESKSDNNTNAKLRMCVVEEPEDIYSKRQKYCETLKTTSNISCVWGVDRLDCIRRVQKGQADFSVFSSEDLLAARWASADVLVTSELRYHDNRYEYEVVAVVDNEANINSVHDLRGSKFCHGYGFGYGLKSHWTAVISNYLESVVIPRDCSAELTLSELRIKAASEFFGPSCKAGIWDEDQKRDKILKNKYSKLCELCYNKCDIGDKHWGRRGSLYCLTSGGGDVTFARLDDVRVHFGLGDHPSDVDPNNYSYLCLDGHLQPLTTKNPCSWVAKPWPVIAARRKMSGIVQTLMDDVIHSDPIWKNTFLLLVENYYVNLTNVDIMVPIEDYIDESPGYQSAYSFPQCNPSRSIVYCTTSIIEFNKCSWLQEATDIQGIEPGIQCVRRESTAKCMNDILHGMADVVRVKSDDMIKGIKKYKLEVILHEFAKEFKEKNVIVPVTMKSDIKSVSNLYAKSICLPKYMGTAYASVYSTIKSIYASKGIEKTSEIFINDYFSKDSCIWSPGNMPLFCKDQFRGENGSLDCLLNGHDVAFVTYKTFISAKNDTKYKNIRPICLFPTSKSTDNICYTNWFSQSALMVNQDLSLTRKAEIYNTFKRIDKLFGKQYGHLNQLRIYAPFEKQSNVLFEDSTYSLMNASEINWAKHERFLNPEIMSELAHITFRTQSDSRSVFQVLDMKLIFTISLMNIYTNLM
uniref:CSON004075 protein n=1 Tax=Culicoides sonorensis TaxID=179676 RepID=A0A336LVW1_CULSO